jgi:hypothetical protein
MAGRASSRRRPKCSAASGTRRGRPCRAAISTPTLCRSLRAARMALSPRRRRCTAACTASRSAPAAGSRNRPAQRVTARLLTAPRCVWTARWSLVCSCVAIAVHSILCSEELRARLARSGSHAMGRRSIQSATTARIGFASVVAGLTVRDSPVPRMQCVGTLLALRAYLLDSDLPNPHCAKEVVRSEQRRGVRPADDVCVPDARQQHVFDPHLERGLGSEAAAQVPEVTVREPYQRAAAIARAQA